MQRIIKEIKDLPAQNATQSGDGSTSAASANQIDDHRGEKCCRYKYQWPSDYWQCFREESIITHIVGEKPADSASSRG
jgi:hypothetical protein